MPIRLNMSAPLRRQLRPLGSYYVSNNREFQVHLAQYAVQHRPPVRPRGRFAPSPTGPLHLGSLTAALGSWLMARHQGGEWLVRIEDLDPPREVPGMAQRQLRALAAFGLVSDGPVVWQSERSAFYELALRRLLEAGLAFECRCSRSDLAGSRRNPPPVRRAPVRIAAGLAAAGCRAGRSDSRTAFAAASSRTVGR